MTDNRLIIGNLGMADIVIADEGVAARHAFVYLHDGKVCLDLQPGCTALLNGNIVEEGRYWLQDSDIVVIGSQRLDLYRIGLALEAQDYNPTTDGALTLPVDAETGLSDAVELKHNPWPAIIAVAIILAVGTFFGVKIYRNHKAKASIEEQMRRTQDSIDQAIKTIDSLHNELQQFEYE